MEQKGQNMGYSKGIAFYEVSFILAKLFLSVCGRIPLEGIQGRDLPLVCAAKQTREIRRFDRIKRRRGAPDRCRITTCRAHKQPVEGREMRFPLGICPFGVRRIPDPSCVDMTGNRARESKKGGSPEDAGVLRLARLG